MPTRPSNDAELGALTLVANRNSCWERELICLCLEYIPTNLEDMLLASKA